MSTDTTSSGANAPEPIASTDGGASDADRQELVAGDAAVGEHVTPRRDTGKAPLLAEGQREMGQDATAEAAERGIPTGAEIVGPGMQEPLAELSAVPGAGARNATEQPSAAEPAQPPELEVWGSDADQLTDPAYVPPSYANAAPPADPWAQTSVSPDYVPPSIPYLPPYATPDPSMQANAAPAEEPFPRAPGYPPRYAPPVYPLPAVRRSRAPLWGVLIAVALAAVVVLILVRGVLSASGRSTTGPLYSNAMTSSSSNWPDDKECYFRGDGYHIVGASNCYYSGAQYQDATITVTATLLKGDAQGAYGIAFRRPSPDKFYIFLINASGDWFTVKDNTLLQKAQFSPAIKTGVGASNTLSVRMQGDHFTFFANGTQLGSLTDGTYTTGAVGLAGDMNLDVVYRNFTVTRP